MRNHDGRMSVYSIADSNPYKPPSSKVASRRASVGRTGLLWSNWASRLIAYAVGSYLFGSTIRIIRPYFDIDGVHYESIFAMILLTLWVLLLSLYYRRQAAAGTVIKFLRLFLFEMAVIWLGYTLGWLSFDAGVQWDIVSSMVLLCPFSALLGVSVILVGAASA